MSSIKNEPSSDSHQEESSNTQEAGGGGIIVPSVYVTSPMLELLKKQLEDQFRQGLSLNQESLKKVEEKCNVILVKVPVLESRTEEVANLRRELEMERKERRENERRYMERINKLEETLGRMGSREGVSGIPVASTSGSAQQQQSGGGGGGGNEVVSILANLSKEIQSKFKEFGDNQANLQSKIDRMKQDARPSNHNLAVPLMVEAVQDLPAPTPAPPSITPELIEIDDDEEVRRINDSSEVTNQTPIMSSHHRDISRPDQFACICGAIFKLRHWFEKHIAPRSETPSAPAPTPERRPTPVPSPAPSPAPSSASGSAPALRKSLRLRRKGPVPEPEETPMPGPSSRISDEVHTVEQGTTTADLLTETDPSITETYEFGKIEISGNLEPVVSAPASAPAATTSTADINVIHGRAATPGRYLPYLCFCGLEFASNNVLSQHLGEDKERRPNLRGTCGSLAESIIDSTLEVLFPSTGATSMPPELQNIIKTEVMEEARRKKPKKRSNDKVHGPHPTRRSYCICGHRSKNKSSLSRHILYHTFTKGKKIYSKKVKKQQRQRSGPDEERTGGKTHAMGEQTEGPDGKVRIWCQCDKSYSSKKLLQRHIRVASSRAIFQCHLCPKQCNDNSLLKAHMRNMHRIESWNKGKFACSSCAEVFDSRTQLQAHREALHKQQ